MEDTATCIVAIVKDGIITMGCDSAASNSESLKLNIREDKKIFVRNKEKQKWMLLSGLALLGIIGGLLFYQSSNRRKINRKSNS